MTIFRNAGGWPGFDITLLPMLHGIPNIVPDEEIYRTNYQAKFLAAQEAEVAKAAERMRELMVKEIAQKEEKTMSATDCKFKVGDKVRYSVYGRGKAGYPSTYDQVFTVRDAPGASPELMTADGFWRTIAYLELVEAAPELKSSTTGAAAATVTLRVPAQPLPLSVEQWRLVGCKRSDANSDRLKLSFEAPDDSDTTKKKSFSIDVRGEDLRALNVGFVSDWSRHATDQERMRTLGDQNGTLRNERQKLLADYALMQRKVDDLTRQLSNERKRKNSY